MRLIDGDELKKVLQKRADELMDEGCPTMSGTLIGAIGFLLNAPTIDVPVVKGEWCIDEFGHKCSVCNEHLTDDQFEFGDKSYCPSCGAKME